MASENFVQPSIPRFDGHYGYWSMLMENFLRSKEYWQAIDRSILETILCKESSKEIWESMKKKYQGSSRVKRAQLQALRKDFETLQMKGSESVTNYYARTMGIVNKSKDIDTFSLDELQSSLLVHEQKMNRSTTSDEQALKAFTFAESSNTRGWGRGRGRGRGRGMGGQGNRDKGRQYQNFNNDQSKFQGRGRGCDHQFDTHGRGRGCDHQFDKSKVECFRCHKFGHYSSECYVELPHDKEKWEKSNFVEKTEVETLLMTYHVKKEPESDVWYVDIGCSNHMYVEERIEPWLQSSNADHMTDHLLQSSHENLTADDLIDDQPRSRKRPAWLIDYVSGDYLFDDDF
ncbi:hypothetical protein LWI28_024667 [Acer negundo]|uniref:CCHC-type domain-containing protein n=1 Tax=Acer negundo TaxID=4023 RepID=A0AAD5J7S1_ACENE|nr:hypothetical protein LWI28_024667 [Acer negundo]